MRARTVAAFVLGFAGGLLVLGVVLWRMGVVTIHFPVSMAAAVPAWKKPMAPLPLDLRDVAAAARNMPPPQVAPTPPPLPAPPLRQPSEPAGEADRALPGQPPPPSMPHLAMPIAGVDPKTLHDSFSEVRDGRKHEALDIMAPRGTPVLAVAEGNVAKLFTSKQGGLTVYQYDDSRTWCYYYAHLDRYAKGLAEGTLLRKGDVLGYVGSTGNASANAPHLHFAVFELKPDKKWWTGTAIDPLPLLE